MVLFTKLIDLRPSEDFDGSVGRASAAGAAAFLIFGSLKAAGVLPILCRESLVLVSGMTGAFLSALVLALAHYHKRMKLGICAGAIFFVLPFIVNAAWATLFEPSLIYPTAALIAFSGILVQIAHRKISGPQPEDEVEEELIRQMVEDESRLTWMEKATRWCFLVGTILFLILLAR
jgi:hypothetical protein